MTDERLTPEQGLVQMGAGIGTELAMIEDRELARRIARETAAAFARGMRRGEAARAAMADEPDPDPGTIVGEVRMIGPAEIRARRWGA